MSRQSDLSGLYDLSTLFDQSGLSDLFDKFNLFELSKKSNLFGSVWTVWMV